MYDGTNWINIPTNIVEGTIAAATGTTTIPYDSTAPLITEGTEFGAAPVTLNDAGSDVHINFNFSIAGSTNNSDIVIAVFRGSVCIAAYPIGTSAANSDHAVSMAIDDAPGTVGPHTYSGRIGVSAGTWKVNTPVGGTLGGMVVAGSLFRLEEKSH